MEDPIKKKATAQRWAQKNRKLLSECSYRWQKERLKDPAYREKYNEKQREYRRTHRDKMNQAAKRYREKHPEVIAAAYERRKQIIKLNPAAHCEKIKAYNRRNPEKTYCRDKVKKAVAKGVLVKRPCCLCGSEKVVAHHDDYNYPLRVRWMCIKCHLNFHREKRIIMAQTS
jgi:ribosomal protein S27AE